MKGYILDYTVQTNSGIISGDDNQRYNFRGADWKETEPPRRRMRVDFVAVGDAATEIYGFAATAPRPSSTKIAAGILAIFLGWLGIHKFYLGYTGPGIILLLCGNVGWFLIVPGIIAPIVGLIEGIIYLTKQDDEFEEEYVVQKKPWF